jgi:polar amino acid transport system substrate-binding protein
MWNRLSIVCLGLCAAIALPAAATAETVIDKVARTGVLTFGTRVDIIPYSYVNDKEKVVGYSVDVIELIRQELQRKLNRPVTVEFKLINDADELIQKVSEGQVDIACSSQFTWQREDYVDYSLPYSLSGIRLVVRNNGNLTGTSASLVGKRVGIIPNSMGQVAMKKVQPKAVLVPFKEVDEAIDQLRAGKIDAFAGDSIVLAGTILKSDATGFRLVPVQPYARYGVGCMIPQNNSILMNSVNRAIAKLMQGYLINDQKYVGMVNQWLGPDGLVPLPSGLIRAYFEMIIQSHEQIPLTDNPQVQGR